ncbi:hypothetical protein N665_0383s0165 [Sinapis alba]|nr:hypothetical protein N665_0383s0165 [Sinapis alba]
MSLLLYIQFLFRWLIGPCINRDWHDNLSALQREIVNQVDPVFIWMVFQTAIYHIWKEGKARRHQINPQSVDQMIKITDKTVRNRIFSLRYKADHKFGSLMVWWFEVNGG